MRRYHAALIVVVLLLGAYTIAFGQGEEKIFIPSISAGIAAAESSTPTQTPTPTNTGDANSTNTPTATPTNIGEANSTNTPTTTPTNTPTEQATGPSPEITIRDNKSTYLDSLGNYVIVGEIQNTGLANAAFVHMTAELYGSGSNLLATGTGIAYDRVIIPNEASCFRITVQDPPPSDSIAFVAYPYTLTEGISLFTGLNVFDASTSYSSGLQEFHITGKVRNTTDATAPDVTVSATVYNGPDQTGDVLHCGGATTIPADIPPSQDATFEVIFITPDESIIGSYHVEAQLDPTQGN
jgi:hypothetical protein